VLLLLLLVGGLLAVVLTRVGPIARTKRERPLFEGARQLSAADHRSLADRAAAEGRFADAVRERLRAVVRELEARGVLDPRPGRTAGRSRATAGGRCRGSRTTCAGPRPSSTRPGTAGGWPTRRRTRCS
jgi:hypothetical protein